MKQSVLTATVEDDVATVQDDLYETSKGAVIRYQGISPFKLQLVQGLVLLPEKPTYTIKTATGKSETFFLDEEVAPTIEYGLQIWRTYLENKQSALDLQNKRSTEAIFRMGCKIVSWGNVGSWKEDYLDLGIPLPEKERDLEVFYLQNELNGKEIQELLGLVMKQSGASEEDVKKAEETFRGEVPARSE